MNLPPPAQPEAFYASGEFRHSLDEKNRLAVPAPWRGAGGGEGAEFFLLPSADGCLWGYPPAEFRAVTARANANPALTPDARRAFVRQFNSRARSLTLDKQGRLVVPPDMVAAAGLKDSAAVVLIGNGERFEVWASERWTAKAAQEAHDFQRASDLLGL